MLVGLDCRENGNSPCLDFDLGVIEQLKFSCPASIPQTAKDQIVKRPLTKGHPVKIIYLGMMKKAALLWCHLT